MKIHCPNPLCFKPHQREHSSTIIKYGSYFRRSDSKQIVRYHCNLCKRHFSSASFSANYYQKKRRLNPLLYKLFCSGVSQRRAAKILYINPKTVVRKFRHLATQASLRQKYYFNAIPESSIPHIQFDDLESSIHSKCKPVSVCIAIEPKTRKILDFQVSQMPAKGKLAKISLKKYGYREDQRHVGWKKVFTNISPKLCAGGTLSSDSHIAYPRYLAMHFKTSHKHVQHMGLRGCVTGQGELKQARFDPLFSLNHSYAMFRANMNRLFRKTWCTSKTVQGLIDHLWLYMDYHNRFLINKES